MDDENPPPLPFVKGGRGDFLNKNKECRNAKPDMDIGVQ